MFRWFNTIEAKIGLFLLAALLVAGISSKLSSPVPEELPAIASSTQNADPKLERLRAAREADKTLSADVIRRNGEAVAQFNTRITSAFARWEAVQKAHYGDPWRNKYYDDHNNPPKKEDCSIYYGSIIRVDDVIRGARIACAANNYLADNYRPPEVPELSRFLLPLTSEPATAEVAADEVITDGARYFISGLDPHGDNWLALRTEPSLTEGERIKQMGPETSLVAEKRRGNWVFVRLATGETGWASATHVVCCRPAAN